MIKNKTKKRGVSIIIEGHNARCAILVGLQDAGNINAL